MSSEVTLLRRTYEELEPPDTDAWNPLHNDVELWHRARLLIESAKSFRKLPVDISTLSVLDVGCGVGRSTRMMVELGFNPHNLHAIDLRDDAINYARSVSSDINYTSMSTIADWPTRQFDICMQCTAFSSLPGGTLREETAKLMTKCTVPGGYIFWWDITHAHAFAGNVRLRPEKLFPDANIVYKKRLSILPTLAEGCMSLKYGRRLVRRALNLLPVQHTHECYLFRL